MKRRIFKWKWPLIPIVMGVVVLAGFSGAVMLLWNWLIPPIFGLISINYWQAAGLFVLARILVGHFGGGHRHRFGGENHIHERWHNMSAEQREEFIKRRKEAMKSVFGARQDSFHDRADHQ